ISSIDADTGLASVDAMNYALNTGYNFISKYPIEVSFTLVEINDIEHFVQAYGETQTYEMLREVGLRLKKCARTGDLVAHIGSGGIGAMLVDCNKDSARFVTKRIKEKVES